MMRNDDSNRNIDDDDDKDNDTIKFSYYDVEYDDIIIITYNLLVSEEPYLYYHYQEVVGQLSIYQSLDSSHASMIYIYIIRLLYAYVQYYNHIVITIIIVKIEDSI